MTGPTPETLAPRRRPMLPAWTLIVAESRPLTPRMQRVTFTVGGHDAFVYRPGQALVCQIPLGNGETGRRDYTIRGYEPEHRRLAIDFVLHGETPGPRWALSVLPGDLLETRGPRGGTVLRPDADWHLMTGDETCIPAILHLLEALPAGAKAHAFIEVADAADEQPVVSRGDVTLRWLHRGGPAGPGSFMLDHLKAFALPAGRGHAYLIGETSNVRGQRHHLLARGMERPQIASEGYWRPGRIGGHDHVED